GKLCNFDEFRCERGKCIPVGQVCDSTQDCDHGSDEMFCNETAQAAAANTTSVLVNQSKLTTPKPT
ncbi:low-density lipoprotein receptor, partial [Elysia marginata]